MEANVNAPKVWLRDIDVEIEPDRLKRRIEELLDQYKERAEIRGFRKGKVPKHVLEKRLGGAIESSAVEEIVDQASQEVLHEKDLKPAAPPRLVDLDVADDKRIRFRLRVEVFPEFELKPYEGLKLKKQEPEGFDQEFDRRLETLQNKCATFRAVPRPARLGDFVVADIRTFDGETEFGKTKENHMIEVGDKLNFPQVNQALTGSNPGDERTTELKLPEDYPDRQLAGRKVNYRFKVREVKEKQVPKVDEDFATDLGYEDLNALRQDINDQLISERKRLTENGLKNQVFDFLVDEHDFEPPESWVKANIERLRREYELPDDDETTEKLKALATRRARFDIVATRIAQDQNICVSEAEIRLQIEELARSTKKQPEEVAPLLDNPAYRSQLLREKVLKYVLDKSEIT